MDPCDYQILPSAPVAQPAFNVCLVCSYNVNVEPKKFPCGCTFYIHRECIANWRTQNYTCPTCNQIVLNVIAEPQMRQMRVFTQYENSILIARQNECMCRVMIVFGIVLFAIVFGTLLCFVPWKRLAN